MQSFGNKEKGIRDKTAVLPKTSFSDEQRTGAAAKARGSAPAL